MSCWGYITVGMPFLIIPAFSSAISANVFPNKYVWSKLIEVITWSIGLITLVESNLPPKPTSITPMSIFSFLKY